MWRRLRGRSRTAGSWRRNSPRTTANRNIAELGIGTNDRATRPDNILEAEKILGTIHIALGDNSRVRRDRQHAVPRGLRLLSTDTDRGHGRRGTTTLLSDGKLLV